MATQCCHDCDGVGSTLEWDDGRWIGVTCEGCEGCGVLEDCPACLCPAPGIEVDRWQKCHACHSEMMEVYGE